MTSTENPPTAAGHDLIPGDTDAPAHNPALAGELTADKAKPLIPKEVA